MARRPRRRWTREGRARAPHWVAGGVLAASALLACGSCAEDASDGNGASAAEGADDASDDNGTTAAEAGDDAASAVAIDLIAAAFRGDPDPNGLQWDDANARCSAEAVVDSLGVDRLREIGLDAETGEPPQLSEPPLTPDEADRVFRLIGECVDLRAQLIDFIADSGVPPDQASCIADAYLATPFPQASLMSSEYDPELNEQIDAALSDAAAQCGQG